MSIAEFYNNQVIFMTGGSGFIGKAIIEKLLRSCPGIEKIYVLIRKKKGKTVQERIEQTLKNPCFRRVWKENPEIFKKVIPMQGDCCELGLGMSPDDMERLSAVSIIIHAAATVRFDEPLREAVFMNTRGTREILNIALNLRNLKAFVHISTTYSNPSQNVVYEKVYEPNADWRDVIKFAETVDPDTLDILTAKIRSGHLNTYTFTKNLAEKIVFDYKEKLPVTIFRPSIVISSIEEPLPGWIDNVNGPIGTVIACGTGLKRTDFCNTKVVLALVPADIVVRGIIVACYKLATEKAHSTMKKDIEIYNCALNTTAPFSIDQLMTFGQYHIRKNPFKKTIWVPGGGTHRFKLPYLLQVLLMQVTFSVLLDGILRLKGEKPMAMKLQRICVNASKALHYFMSNNLDFKSDNFLELENVVPPDDKKTFGFIKKCYLNYEKFFPDVIFGIKEFILDEPHEATKGSLIRMKVTMVLNYMLQAISLYYVLKFLYRIFIL